MSQTWGDPCKLIHFLPDRQTVQSKTTLQSATENETHVMMTLYDIHNHMLTYMYMYKSHG